MDRYNRSNFYKTEVADLIPEKDMATNNINDIKFKRNMTSYIVTEQDLKRPDLISFKSYGQDNLWWLIAKANNIEDFFNDLEVGQSIKIPDKLDIDDFYLENKRKNMS